MNRKEIIVILVLWLIAGISAIEIRAQGLMQEYSDQAGTSLLEQSSNKKFHFVMNSGDLVFQYGSNLMQKQQFDLLAKQVAELKMPRIKSIIVTSYTSSTQGRAGSGELANVRIAAVKDYLIRTIEHNELHGVEIQTQILSVDDDQSRQSDEDDIYNKVRCVEFIAYLDAENGYVPIIEPQLDLTQGEMFDSNSRSSAQEDRQLAAIVTNLFPVRTSGGSSKRQRYPTPVKQQSSQEYSQPVRSPRQSYSTNSEYTGSVNQKFAFKTNIPYWLVAAPNLGIEVYMGGHTSLLMESMISYWNKKTDAGTNGVYVFELGSEFRYWLNDDRSEPSHFFGVYGQYVDFDIKLNETGRQGNSIGGGISYGYYLPVGNRWAFEFGIGIGYLRNKFDVYKWNALSGDNGENVWVENKATTWIGPTKIKAAVIFRIGNKR